MGKWYFAAGLLIISLGCTHPKPPKPPEPPTPEPEIGRPSSPVGLESLVRTNGNQFYQVGKPVALVGAIPCWPTDGTDEKLFAEGKLIPYLWPLVSPEWIDYATSKGANTFHVRPGPVSNSNLCCGLETIGGPINDNGTPNPKFWDTFHKASREAVAKKAILEVDVLDTWIIKHAIWGDVQTPLNAHTAMNVPLSEDVKAWVKKVVYESCNYGNVIYEIGNESDLLASDDWEREMYKEIRSAEQQPGCERIVHVIGSAKSLGDYEISHNPNAQFNGTIPLYINEYNPHLSPATVAGRVCEAKKTSQGFAYWRSDGSDDDQNQSMNLISKGCEGPIVSQCPDPKPNREAMWFQFGPGCPSNCDTTPMFRDYPYCVSIGMGEMGGNPRGNCPARNECGPTGKPVPGDPASFQCDMRLPCEQYAMQAPHPIFHSDGKVIPLDANGFRVSCEGCSYLEACDLTSTHCSRIEF